MPIFMKSKQHVVIDGKLRPADYIATNTPPKSEPAPEQRNSQSINIRTIKKEG